MEAQLMGETLGVPRTPPVLGKDRAQDFKPAAPEQERWITIDTDSWMYDGPIWDRNRIRLGRIRKPARARILQELKNPKGKGMDALEVVHPWKDEDGKDHSSRFWVYPRKGGFYGMPPKPKVKPNPTLGL